MKYFQKFILIRQIIYTYSHNKKSSHGPLLRTKLVYIYISIYLKGGCMFFLYVCVCVFFFVRSRFSPRLCEPEGRAIAHSKALSIPQIWFSFDFWFSRSFARKSGKTSFSRQFSVYPTINWGKIQFFGYNFWLIPYS